MISRLLLGLGSFSNSMLYTFIFIFFTYQLIEPQLIYTMNCDGEVIHPGQIINILQKKEKMQKMQKNY